MANNSFTNHIKLNEVKLFHNHERIKVYQLKTTLPTTIRFYYYTDSNFESNGNALKFTENEFFSAKQNDSTDRASSHLNGVDPGNTLLLPEFPHDHVAQDFGAVVVVFVAVLDEAKSVDVANVRLSVGAQQVETANVLRWERQRMGRRRESG